MLGNDPLQLLLHPGCQAGRYYSRVCRYTTQLWKAYARGNPPALQNPFSFQCFVLDLFVFRPLSGLAYPLHPQTNWAKMEGRRYYGISPGSDVSSVSLTTIHSTEVLPCGRRRDEEDIFVLHSDRQRNPALAADSPSASPTGGPQPLCCPRLRLQRHPFLRGNRHLPRLVVHESSPPVSNRRRRPHRSPSLFHTAIAMSTHSGVQKQPPTGWSTLPQITMRDFGVYVCHVSETGGRQHRCVYV